VSKNKILITAHQAKTPVHRLAANWKSGERCAARSYAKLSEISGDNELSDNSFFATALDGDGLLASHYCCFISKKKTANTRIPWADE
jgi:hypothetical protein